MKTGDVVNLTGTYATNPKHYEVFAELTDSQQLAIDATLQIEGDDRTWYVAGQNGNRVCLRLKPNTDPVEW